MKIVFLGDSVTDCGKNSERGSLMPIGQSYAMLICSRLGRDEPGQHSFVNSGISGNRCVDILARIKADCWNYQPDVVSFLVGVNDVWHEFGHRNGVSPERYEAVMRMILSDTRKALPDVKYILMSPYFLKDAFPDGYRDEFKAELDKYEPIVRKLAAEFNASFISLQDIFDGACGLAPASYWAGDGVHATPAGHQLIADAWLEAFRADIQGVK